MYNCKIHRHKGELLVACCDSEHVGKTLSEGDMQLQVKEDFYGKGQASLEEIQDHLDNATIANILGDKIVGELVKNDFLEEGSVIKVCGVSHAQLMSI